MTRVGLTWNSQVNLDFSSQAQFSNLAPGLNTALTQKGLVNSTIDVGITVPQQLMASVFSQLTDRWAVLGSVGWQQWSKFGQVELGIEDTLDPKKPDPKPGFQGYLASGGRCTVSHQRTVAAEFRHCLRFRISGQLQCFPSAAGKRRLAVRRGGREPDQQDLSMGFCGGIRVRRIARHEPAKRLSGGSRFTRRSGGVLR